MLSPFFLYLNVCLFFFFSLLDHIHLSLRCRTTALSSLLLCLSVGLSYFSVSIPSSPFLNSPLPDHSAFVLHFVSQIWSYLFHISRASSPPLISSLTTALPALPIMYQSYSYSFIPYLQISFSSYLSSNDSAAPRPSFYASMFSVFLYSRPTFPCVRLGLTPLTSSPPLQAVPSYTPASHSAALNMNITWWSSRMAALNVALQWRVKYPRTTHFHFRFSHTQTFTFTVLSYLCNGVSNIHLEHISTHTSRIISP